MADYDFHQFSPHDFEDTNLQVKFAIRLLAPFLVRERRHLAQFTAQLMLQFLYSGEIELITAGEDVALLLFT